MLDRVTDRNARHWNGGDNTELALDGMDDGRTTRFAKWKSELHPQSHVLTKLVGDTISGSWSVKNTGGVSGFGRLDIIIPSLGTGWIGSLTAFAAGATITLSVSGVITTLVPGNTYTMELQIRAANPGIVAPGGIHTFSVTIPPLANAVLEAQGFPSIT